MAELYLGIDGGGSRCRAVIGDSRGRIIGRGLGGPANPYHGVELAWSSVRDATYQALHAAGLPVRAMHSLRACFGLAGVNLPSVHAQTRSWRGQFAQLLVVGDLPIACLAAHGGDGAVIVVGTGSCGYANIDGEETLMGGHGFPAGDQASGAWLGLKAVEHTLLALDGFVAQGVLSESVREHFKANKAVELLEALQRAGGQRGYASLAPAVFDAARRGDANACRLIEAGAEYLAQLAERLLAGRSLRLSLIGGLAAPMHAWLPESLSARLSPPKEEAVHGALRLALQTWPAP